MRYLSLLLLLAAALYSQTATLTGVVRDTSGAVMPSVAVTATQTDKNLKLETSTDPTGRYILQNLPIGPYTVHASLSGFKVFRQAGVELTVDQRALLNITLEVGQLAETVDVEGQVIRVDTESATIQQLVDARRVVDLPLNGRNVYQLAALVPGTGKGGFNINGSRDPERDAGAIVRLDGALNIEQSFLRLLPAPPPDAVQEFTIQTSVPSAKYPYSGGVIEIGTKSGTNGLHGALYDFFRNDKLDARSFFSPIKTYRRRNQYGAAVGGPLWLPGLYNGRNRTFWFFNFEQQKEPRGDVTTVFVPTAAQRDGDFSRLGAVRDPADNNRPFPGGIVPRSRLDPLALNLLREFVPVAQFDDGRYIYQRPADSNPTRVLARGDHAMGANQFTWRTFSSRIVAPEANGNLPYFADHQAPDKSDNHTFSYTRILSPRTINVFRLSYNNRDFGRRAVAGKHDIFTPEKLRQLGWSDQYYNITNHAPHLIVSGSFTFNNTASSFTFVSPTWTWEDDLTLNRGRHNITLGARVMRTYYRVRDNHVREAGSFNFNGQTTGFGMTDFMLGRPSALDQQNQQFANIHHTHIAGYLQDDIKLTPRLTVNVGLRYELPLAQIDEDGKVIVYRPGSTQQSVRFPSAPPGLLFIGDAGISNTGRETPKRDFGPRIGFSWALTADQKTVLRGGYGLLYTPIWTNVEGQYINRQPWVSRYQISFPFSTADPWRNQPNFPTGNPFPVKSGDPAFVFRSGEVFSYAPNYADPNSQHWNLNLQREFAKDYLLTLAYVGTKGTHLLLRTDKNAAVYRPGQSTPQNNNNRRPLFPALTVLEWIESGGNSSFQSAQVSLDKRFARGFSVLTSYTFGKSLDTDVGAFSAFPQNPDDFRAERGPSNYDRTHSFVTSWVWDVPGAARFTGPARQLLGGWQVSGIAALYSGAPLSLSASTDRALRAMPNRPDRLRDARLSTSRPRGDLAAQYFDISAYVPNQTGDFGSAPRSESQLRGPGSAEVTLGINKHFRFTERHGLQFRSEFFNLLNRPNFSNPGTNIDTRNTLGRITGAGEGRIIQFALKYLF